MKDIRLLELYDRLLKNADIDIKKYAEENKINIRTAERDIKTIRNFLAKKNETKLIHNSKKKKYQLTYTEDSVNLTKSEILAVSKILLASRAFLKDEISLIIDKIAKQCGSEEDLKSIQNLLNNEKFHYVELQHKKSFINNIWDLGAAIKNKQRIEMLYKDKNGEIKKRVVEPVGLMFSEFYFYLLANIQSTSKEKNLEVKSNSSPTVYRVDRIVEFKVLNEKYTSIFYKTRFQEGEFRKQVQFMTGGKLRNLKINCLSYLVEALLDKIPTAKIEKKNGDTYLISAKVYGNGINRWMFGQEGIIEVIEK